MNRLSVVIVAHNCAGEIARCLEALVSSAPPPGEICLIDNASADGAIRIVQAFPSVRLIVNRRNMGFAAACNQGIEKTAGDLICFLNPDAWVSPDALPALVRSIDHGDDRTAGVGPKLLRSRTGPGKMRVLDSAGMALSHSRLSPYDRGQGEYDEGRYDRGAGYLGPSGACALFRRSALLDLAVNGEIFDEDFFAYYEDVDLAWRARLFGWSFQFVPEAIVLHDRKNPHAHGVDVQARAFVNRWFCALKNDPDLGRYLGSAAYEALRLGYQTLSRPGFARALDHFLDKLSPMIRKREKIQQRRVLDPASLKEFE